MAAASNVVDLVVIDEQNSLANRIKQWLSHMSTGLEPSTVNRYREALNRFQLFQGTSPVNGDNWVRFQRHQIGLGSSPGYLHKDCTIISQFFRWCELHGYISVNPCRFGIRLPPIIVKLQELFTYDDYEKMKEVASGRRYEYWLVVASYNTGAALCDVCLLKWSMIDMENMVINFVRKKTKRFQTPSTIPFLPGSDLHKCLTLLAEEIGNGPSWPGSEYVCQDLAGRYLTCVGTPVRIAARIIKAAGIIGKTHKTFRWTFISNWANSGASTALGCKVVGTKDPALFARYVNPDVGAMREAIQQSMDKARERCGKPKTALIPV